MTLIDAPDRWWDAQLMSHEVGVSARVASAALDRFASGNMLDIRVNSC